MQTGGAGSGAMSSVVGAGGKLIIDKPQQTHNSFGLSNVSTNVNNNFNAGKSYSANKQLQSTNTTGYNFASSGDSKPGGARRDLSKHYNAYQNDLQNNFMEIPTSNMNFSNVEQKSGKGIAAMSSVKGANKGAAGPIKATPMPQQEYMNTI